MTEQRKYARDGSLIMWHGRRRIPPRSDTGDPRLIHAITDHVHRHLGRIEMVLHELRSDLVHLDAHLVEPSRARPFRTLVTSGMSRAPMLAPAEGGGVTLAYAELMISLPSRWPLSRAALRNDDFFWPVRELLDVARLPHAHDTWLDHGHTVAAGPVPEPFARRTGFCSMLLLRPRDAPEGFATLELDSNRLVEFFALVPLFREELEFKLEHGLEALLERFDRHGVGEVVDVTRPNVCGRRRS